MDAPTETVLLGDPNATSFSDAPNETVLTDDPNVTVLTDGPNDGPNDLIDDQSNKDSLLDPRDAESNPRWGELRGPVPRILRPRPPPKPTKALRSSPRSVALALMVRR